MKIIESYIVNDSKGNWQLLHKTDNRKFPVWFITADTWLGRYPLKILSPLSEEQAIVLINQQPLPF